MANGRIGIPQAPRPTGYERKLSKSPVPESKSVAATNLRAGWLSPKNESSAS